MHGGLVACMSEGDLREKRTLKKVVRISAGCLRFEEPRGSLDMEGVRF